ncbi:MAG: hypothetical protein WA116_09055 [Anaerolineaceae bacterium]
MAGIDKFNYDHYLGESPTIPFWSTRIDDALNNFCANAYLRKRDGTFHLVWSNVSGGSFSP